MKKYSSIAKQWMIPLLAAVFLFSCKKDDDDPVPIVPEQNSIHMDLSYEVDGQALLFDSLIYTNDAGSLYGVSRLWYYLSQISLVKSDSTLVHLKDYQFVDAASSSTNHLHIENIPTGTYIGMKFNIGLDSAQNITGGLPATVENLNMEWPVMMGGGYHFMKFEGHVIDTAGSYGFAMHLGLNPYLVRCNLWTPIQVVSGETNLNLRMNLNEWFRNPAVYDFNTDGNYSMGVMSAMVKLTNNGSDVFTLQ
ncbi:MAG: hypothetical protein KA444_02150 [Bacteroidia bacterium]|nr:hypothetical protein [Bacteroidia bacterium]